jgi:hypothetical protein
VDVKRLLKMKHLTENKNEWMGSSKLGIYFSSSLRFGKNRKTYTY